MLLTLSQQLDLVKKGLAVSKTNGNLITFKYHRRVMYDYLWKKHPELLECRGHTYDLNTGEIVLAAPTKSFNYLEDGWWKDVPLNTTVSLYQKFNGFMATMSVYNGEIIIGTTGTTSSDYAIMAREMLYARWPKELILNTFSPNGTYLFEICHPNDPHIVDEKYGAKYLGYRSKVTDQWYDVGEYIPGRDSGEFYGEISLSKALEIVKNVKHEGFMVYDQNGDVCKLKSPYYVGKKKLMRMNQAGVHSMYTQQDKQIANLPDMWYSMVTKIVNRFEEGHWMCMDAQSRRMYIEQME